jgi:hypothetical protein
MSASWYPHLVISADETAPALRVEHAFEIAVDDPGYGYLWMRLVELRAMQYFGLEDEGWVIDLAGAQLGDWLHELTARALCVTGEYDSSWEIRDALGRRRSDQVPHWVTSHVARSILPAFQAAVLLAAAGTDRQERILVDHEDGEPPAAPICVRCDVDRIWAGAVATSTYCVEHGHAPFGMVATVWGSPRPLTWQAALERNQARRDRWRREQERRRFDEQISAIAATPTAGAGA